MGICISIIWNFFSGVIFGLYGLVKIVLGWVFGVKVFCLICVVFFLFLILRGGWGVLKFIILGIKFGKFGFSGVGLGGRGRSGNGWSVLIGILFG